LFLSRIGKVQKSDLPPAVWVYRAAQLPSLKVFAEKLEKATGRRTLIGGTPESLKDAGAIFGRTNPLWLSFKARRWVNPVPAGWDRYSIAQSEPSGQVKGVSGKVGINHADPSFISQDKGAQLALGFGLLALVGAGLYFYGKGDE
jgi:GH25 family lysozyme M1 (1,4-beta-N-acetylmuramidase)